ncbi:GNAT family N-acetyltransferase (plasmid) [Embleya sp. NBC_00888]|uniref:GNAT family N-acetyltransferase n=1 Tax=Embleya sp. NBC_00888 TaxID=2975960 RepID=UPI002F91B13E|nr:GNAT family N-acetyltransferase [Embleya sp. NBC_00888]
MAPKIELLLPTAADARLRTEVHHVFHDVARLGGAIGYLTPPAKPATDAWLEDALAAVRAGDAAFIVALVDGAVRATGLWRRRAEPVFAHTAEVEKVMAHPAGRGLGLGRLLMTALMDSARRAGIETLALGVRGNNHGAIELYEELGFTVWGRLPNVIEIDNERFDDIRMALSLGHGPDVVLRGSTPGGPGSSPRRPLTP